MREGTAFEALIASETSIGSTFNPVGSTEGVTLVRLF